MRSYFPGLLLLFHFLILANSIILEGGGGGGGGGGRGRGRPRFSSSSWSSESRERPRPPRPNRPPRPPPVEDPVYVCESGYIKFSRPQGDWCVRVGTANGISQPAAENICREMGATLTGLQNSNERETLAAEGLRLIRNQGVLVAGLWLGANSIPGCKNNPACGALGTFAWTDNHTTGTNGIRWGRGEPDNINWPGDPVCIQQFIISPDFYNSVPPGLDYTSWRAWVDHFQNGDLDKYSCGVGYGPSPMFRLYACGKLAVLQ